MTKQCTGEKWFMPRIGCIPGAVINMNKMRAWINISQRSALFIIPLSWFIDDDYTITVSKTYSMLVLFFF